MAAEESFHGISLADLEAAMALLGEADAAIKALDTRRRAAVNDRKATEATLRDLLVEVVDGVKGAPNHGQNGRLYRAMGYVPRRERASGLIRPGSASQASESEAPGAAGASGNAEAAA
ncbi:hypothetical protein ACFSYE_15525 [Roseibacillus ishigakijimensis]